MKTYIVKNEVEGIRVDKAINIINNELSRVAIQRMIGNANILVNNKKVKASYKLCLNDEITIEEEIQKEANIKAQNIKLNIIYEDKDILIVNKEKGMVVHPGNGNQDGTLVNAVMAYCKEELSRNRW